MYVFRNHSTRKLQLKTWHLINHIVELYKLILSHFFLFQKIYYPERHYRYLTNGFNTSNGAKGFGERSDFNDGLFGGQVLLLIYLGIIQKI